VRRTGILVAALTLALVVGVSAWLLLRPTSRVASSADADVTIVCAASTGIDADACGAWGDEVLAAGPPSTTFELNDLVRLELSRSALGFGDECEAAYYLGRYPDQPVWTEQVACRGGG
jgi:hypothetical protein